MRKPRPNKLFATLSFILTLFIFVPASIAEKKYQKALENIEITNENPAYAVGEGPTIAVHRSSSPYVQRGSFEPFMELARSDGFKLSYVDGIVTTELLSSIDLFVIPNAYTTDYKNYDTLSAPSAYTDSEISQLNAWVKNGGKLLILADHSPFAGGTIKLASSFGFTYVTGHALNKNSLSSLIKVHIDFKKSDGLLADHPITNGSTGRKPVSHFYAFGGQAIIPAENAVNLLIIPNHFEALLGFSPRREFDTAPRMEIGGFSQGATLNYGAGQVMIMGETGGFTAQVRPDGYTFGFAQPSADENKEFILATLRWLTGFSPN